MLPSTITCFQFLFDTLYVLPKSDLNVQQTSLLNKSLSSAEALTVANFKTIISTFVDAL